MTETQASPSRRKTRLLVLQVLYEADAVRRDASHVLDKRLEEDPLTEPAAAFSADLVRGVLENREEIDKIITRFAPGWPISQMAIVEKNILRMAIYEMMLGGETPPKVAINEAVELAKIFGSETSPKFVNGVLGSVMETANP